MILGDLFVAEHGEHGLSRGRPPGSDRDGGHTGKVVAGMNAPPRWSFFCLFRMSKDGTKYNLTCAEGTKRCPSLSECDAVKGERSCVLRRRRLSEGRAVRLGNMALEKLPFLGP